MRRNKVSDPEYLDWIRKQPCCLCGWETGGTTPGGFPRHQAAHHVSGRHNDRCTVPLCDAWLDPLSHDCHKTLVHKNMRYYRRLLEPIAATLLARYLKEKGVK